MLVMALCASCNISEASEPGKALSSSGFTPGMGSVESAMATLELDGSKLASR